MKRLLRTVPAGLLLMLPGLGCAHGSLSVGYYDEEPVRHRHARTYVRTHGCPDCYYDGDRIVVIRGHRHGPGCGHRWDGRHWVVDRPNRVHPKVVPAPVIRKASPAPQEPRVHKARRSDSEPRAHRSSGSKDAPRVQKSKAASSGQKKRKTKSDADPDRTRKSKSKNR